MNFRQQLQEAYEAGYRSGLNELNLQGLKNFGTDLLYGPGYTRRQQSIKDAQKMADRMKFRPGNFAALSPEEKRRLLDVFRKIEDKEIKRLGNR